jgi:YidC/Oxa1 family membrane protein insertase
LLFAAAGCQRPVLVNPDPKPRFDKALELTKTSPDEAMLEYSRIKAEYQNGRANSMEEQTKYYEIAAEALYRAAQFGYDTLDPAKWKDRTRMSETQRVEFENIRMTVGDKAHQAIKELYEQFPKSAWLKKAQEENLRRRLEDRIDERNQEFPTYQIIHTLVKATGGLPYFSYWFALVFVAFAVKLITFPITLRMYKSQREMQRIQPILKQIQEEYKDKSRAEMQEKIMATYKEHGVNPFASCFPLMIQLPFLWWVYNMIRLYEFHFYNGFFLWVAPFSEKLAPGWLAGNLGQFDIVLLLIYAGSNYLTMMLTPASDPQAAQTQKQMAIMMTVMMIWMFLLYKWSAAFMLYWLVLNFISTYQQYVYIYKPNKAQGVGGAPALSLGSGPVPPKSAPAMTPAAPVAEPPRPRPKRKGRK